MHMGDEYPRNLGHLELALLKLHLGAFRTIKDCSRQIQQSYQLRSLQTPRSIPDSRHNEPSRLIANEEQFREEIGPEPASAMRQIICSCDHDDSLALPLHVPSCEGSPALARL